MLALLITLRGHDLEKDMTSIWAKGGVYLLLLDLMAFRIHQAVDQSPTHRCPKRLRKGQHLIARIFICVPTWTIWAELQQTLVKAL